MENIVLRHPAVCDVTIAMAPTSASYRAQVVLNRGCFDVSSNQIKEFVNGKSWKFFFPQGTPRAIFPALRKDFFGGEGSGQKMTAEEVSVDFIFLYYL